MAGTTSSLLLDPRHRQPTHPNARERCPDEYLNWDPPHQHHLRRLARHLRHLSIGLRRVHLVRCSSWVIGSGRARGNWGGGKVWVGEWRARLVMMPVLCFSTVKGADLDVRSMNWTVVAYGGAYFLLGGEDAG